MNNQNKLKFVDTFETVRSWNIGYLMLHRGLFMNGHKLKLHKIYSDTNCLGCSTLSFPLSDVKVFRVHLDLFGLTPTTFFQYDFVRVKYNGVCQIQDKLSEILCKQIFLEKVLDETTLYFEYGIQIHLNEQGQLHREDGPSYVVPYNPKNIKNSYLGNDIYTLTIGDIKDEYWYLNGQLHRDSRDGPAIIKRFNERIGHQPQFIAYYEHNVKHRDSQCGPAIEKYNYDQVRNYHYLMTTEYYERGLHHRDPKVGPAFISYLWTGDIIKPIIQKYYDQGKYIPSISQYLNKRKRDEMEDSQVETRISNNVDTNICNNILTLVNYPNYNMKV